MYKIEDGLFLIKRLISVANDMIAEHGKFSEISFYENILEEVPKGYMRYPTLIERLQGQTKEYVDYKGLEITRVRFTCCFLNNVTDEITGEEKPLWGMGEQLTYHFGIKAHLTEEVVVGFEVALFRRGLLQKTTPNNEIRIDTRPLWSHELVAQT